MSTSTSPIQPSNLNGNLFIIVNTASRTILNIKGGLQTVGTPIVGWHLKVSSDFLN